MNWKKIITKTKMRTFNENISREMKTVKAREVRNRRKNSSISRDIML